MKNNTKNQVANFLKGLILFTVLAVASGCAGGGGQQSASVVNPTGGNGTALPVSGTTDITTTAPNPSQVSLKMALCDEVNGWDTDCRFVGMRLLKQTPEVIIPLAEEHGRNRNRGGREA